MIGIICGAGDLPKMIVDVLVFERRPFVCLAFHDCVPDFFSNKTFASTVIALGEIEKALSFLKQHNVKQLVMAGAIKRPNIFALKFDDTGKKWLKKMGASLLKGDDGLLKSLIKLLEKEGFTILSSKDIVKNLTLSKGLYGSIETISDSDYQDINKGIQILKDLSPYDIGQAIVIEQGLVLGLEAIEGTKQLIERVGLLKRTSTHGVLIKATKINQTLKADLPTIGLETLISCHKAGLKGIAFDAAGTQVLNKDDVLSYSEKNGLFLYAF
jgi:DUF1009 family protein